MNFIRRFHREESAQISFLAVAGVLCFVSLMTMVINTNDLVTERVHMQDVADATVLSAAAWTARGLNTVSFINVLNSKLIATAVLLNAWNDALPIIIAVATVQETIFRACTGVPFIGVACAIAATAVGIQKIALQAMQRIVQPMANSLARCPNGGLWKAMKGLEKLAEPVRLTFGGIGILESVAIAKANGATFGVVLNGALVKDKNLKDAFTLPVKTTKFEDFCPKLQEGGPGYELQGYACNQGPVRLGKERIKDTFLLPFPNLGAKPIFSGMVSKNMLQLPCPPDAGEDTKIPVYLKNLDQCREYNTRGRWSHLYSETIPLGQEHANLSIKDFVPWKPQNPRNAGKSATGQEVPGSEEIAGQLRDLGLPDDVPGGGGGPAEIPLGPAVQFIDKNTEKSFRMFPDATVNCRNPVYPYYSSPDDDPPDFGFASDQRGQIFSRRASCSFSGFGGSGNCKRIDQWRPHFEWRSGRHTSGLRTGNRTTGGYFIRVTKRVIEPSEEGGETKYVYAVETVSLVDAGKVDMTAEEFAEYLKDNPVEGLDGINTDGNKSSENCNKPLPWMLEDKTAKEKEALETRLRFIGLVYKDVKDKPLFWNRYFEESPPKIIAYAQGQVYNYLSPDTFTQDWRVRLEQASLLEQFLKSPKAAGKDGESLGLGGRLIQEVNNH